MNAEPNHRLALLLAGVTFCAIGVLLTLALAVGAAFGFQMLSGGAYVWLCFGTVFLLPPLLFGCFAIFMGGAVTVRRAFQ